ncbi:hypothetical protein [Mesorhizobium sp. LNJC380A00]|uniref:hypothetical protein n=1 Tax=Mesorhizobium sp. LNJC380A00 TaxID=1287264 RepID=UPI0012EC7739|nr:hypothetical protein [Mesorhizobium sp. LNJC380A00]
MLKAAEVFHVSQGSGDNYLGWRCPSSACRHLLPVNKEELKRWRASVVGEIPDNGIFLPVTAREKCPGGQ